MVRKVTWQILTAAILSDPTIPNNNKNSNKEEEPIWTSKVALVSSIHNLTHDR